MHQQSVIEVHIPAKSIDFERERKKPKHPGAIFHAQRKKVLDNIG